MASALLSCLGVPGWGPLHLWLPERGEPAALRERLRCIWWLEWRHGEGDPTAAQLLAGLLRRQRDLVPLSGPAAAERLPRLAYRHRLACPPGERSLRLRSWSWRSDTLTWRPCGAELRLDGGAAARAGTGNAHLLRAGSPLSVLTPAHGTVGRPIGRQAGGSGPEPCRV